MLIQHAYIKPRSQFGKQCFFEETEPIVQENILPDPELMRDYIPRRHSHRGAQKSEQFALHEMQTARKVTKESGMLHLEGGWPKEINVKDEEAVLRFRRRAERSENWAPGMKKLANSMERYIRQNNTVDIYENYFDDMVPTALVLPYNLRISNVYADPQPVVRPVNHLSWSLGAQNRLAASYSFAEFETKPADVNPSSYIWDIENPVRPVMCLRSSSPLIITEFNPRDPPMLISGLMSGQVCNWDIRIGDRPMQMSHRQFSHRNPANQAFWIASKTNTEFFSASTDGTIKWWDIRKLRQPIDVLVMDLDNPLRADLNRAIGVTALRFEPAMSNRFLAGMQNGQVINVNRKVKSPVEKMTMRFNCHVGPVVALDRNPFALKTFLTVGDWVVKIWAENTREDCLIAIREQTADLRGGCWSRSRYSVFFTIDATGLLEVYDILTGVAAPATAFRVCDECLTAIAPHEDGRCLAVGGHDGNIYLVECSEGYTVNTRTDRANLTAYLERCSHFEKTVDARLKEIRRTYVGEDFAAASVSKDRHRKGISKEKGKGKAQVAERGELLKKKPRPRRVGRKDDAFFDGLADTEAAFLHAVEREFASYPSLEDPEIEHTIAKELSRMRKKLLRELSEVDEEAKLTRRKRRVPRARSLAKVEMEVDKEEEVEEVEAPFVKRMARKRREEKTLSKVCAVEVCKPEICCADMAAKRKAALQTRPVSKGKEFFPEEDESLADVLADEAEEARREVRAWREGIVSGKRNLWPPRTTGVVHENPERKKEEAENGDDVSPVRDAGAGRSDFRQLAETSSKCKSGDEGVDETSRARGKREARQLDHHHLGERTQEEGQTSAYIGESKETTTTVSTRRK